MRFSLNERPVANVTVPPPQATFRPVANVTVPPPQATFSVEIDLPQEYIPPGVEETLRKLGWRGSYDGGSNTTVFDRGDGPYANGYYHWYEVVALESMNLLTLGMARDAANDRVRGDGGVSAAVGMR